MPTGSDLQEEEKRVLYFDTSALRELKFNPELSSVLSACRAEAIEVVMSEWTVYEYARNLYQNQKNSIVPLAGSIQELTGISQPDQLRAYHVFMKSTFSKNRIIVVDHSDMLLRAAEEILADETTYFKPEDPNDQRDALILATAIHHVPPDTSTVVSGDKKLSAEFSGRGFSVENDAKSLVKQLALDSGNESIDTPKILNVLRGVGQNRFSESFHNALQKFDSTYAELVLTGEAVREGAPIEIDEALRRVDQMGGEDREIRLRILSYVYWFAPLAKADLVLILQERQVPEIMVSNNADRLIATQSIRDTGTHYLPGSDGVCQAIADSRIDELEEFLAES